MASGEKVSEVISVFKCEKDPDIENFIKDRAAPGKLMPTNIVDHIVPHKGDWRLFWDESNWQALCKPCHDLKTAREDGRRGK